MSGEALFRLLEDAAPARRRQGLALLRSLGDRGARLLHGLLRDDAGRWRQPALRLATLAGLGRVAPDGLRAELASLGDAPAFVADDEELAGTELQAALKLLPSLARLTLVRTGRGSLAPLAVAPGLRSLDIFARGAIDLEPLAACANLERLRLRGRLRIEAPAALPAGLKRLALHGQVTFSRELYDVLPEGLEELDLAHASPTGERGSTAPLPALAHVGVTDARELRTLSLPGPPRSVRVAYVGEDDREAIARLAAELPPAAALRIDRYRPAALDAAVAERLVAVGDAPASAAEWFAEAPRLGELSPERWPFGALYPAHAAPGPAALRRAREGEIPAEDTLRFRALWRERGHVLRLGPELRGAGPRKTELVKRIGVWSGEGFRTNVNVAERYLEGHLELLTPGQARGWAGLLRAAGASPRSSQVAGATKRA
ncbi:MAG: hypothetical protein AAF447_13640 [Myxococcota bacterium]